MTDYAAIADAAEAYADYQSAYAAMSAETVQVQKSLDGRMLNERTVYALIGTTAGETLLQGIEGLPDNQLPARVKAWFAPGAGGIDVLESAAQSIIGAMVQGGAITQAEADTLTAYGYTTEKKWPGIGPDHIRKALEMRARGDI